MSEQSIKFSSMRAYCLTHNTHYYTISYYPRPPKQKQQQQKETTATEKQNKKQQQRGTKSKAKNKTHGKENSIFSEEKKKKSLSTQKRWANVFVKCSYDSIIKYNTKCKNTNFVSKRCEMARKKLIEQKYVIRKRVLC